MLIGRDGGKDTVIFYVRICVELLKITEMEHYRQPDCKLFVIQMDNPGFEPVTI